jgi:hypothetical protein
LNNPPPNLPELGRLAGELLIGDISWIHRRKETVRILDDSWLRRQISIDYEVPAAMTPYRLGRGGEQLFAIPITLMRKSPPAFVNFDMRDEANAAVAMMTREQNAAISLAALRHAAHEAGVQALSDELEGMLHRIATGASVAAGLALRDLIDGRNGEGPLPMLYRSDKFMWLALAFADNSVVMVDVPGGDGRRRLLKLSYDERIVNRIELADDSKEARGGLRPYPVTVDSPFIAAGTYHFELEAPPGLQVVDTSMLEFRYLEGRKPLDDQEPVVRPPEDLEHATAAALSRRGTRTHLYAPDGDLTDRAEVYVLLRVQREGFVSAAAITAVCIALLLTLFLLELPAVIQHQGVVPSLLLLLPGIVATLVGRAGGHQLTIRMLQIARRALLVSAGCVFVAATGLALSRTGDHHSPTGLLLLVWIVITLLSVYCAVLLIMARRLPVREEALTDRDKRFGRAMRPLIRLLGTRFGESS